MPKYIKDDMRERSKTFETGKRPILEIPSKLKDNLSFDSEISESFENNTSILDLEIDVYTKKRDKNYRLIKLEEVNHKNQSYIEAETDDGLYKGALKDGLPHGCGELSTRDGSLYYGDFRSGLKHGYGKMTFRGGKVLNGRWSKNYYIGYL